MSTMWCAISGWVIWCNCVAVWSSVQIRACSFIKQFPLEKIRRKALLIWLGIVISLKVTIMHNVADKKREIQHLRELSLQDASTHQEGVTILRGSAILMWPPGVGGRTDQSDKDSLPGCENESLHRMCTQDPSVGLSWPLALTVANGGLALDQCTERLGSLSLPFHQARKGGILPEATPRSHRPCHSPILWVTAAVPMSLGTPRCPATSEGQPATLSLWWWEGKSLMICSWMSDPCKQPQQTLWCWVDVDMTAHTYACVTKWNNIHNLVHYFVGKGLNIFLVSV